ncbi:MAG: hypothetical protein AAGN46_09810 [Acidobacteriota bacterium]
MSERWNGFPSLELRFGADGAALDADLAEAAIDTVGDATDLIVLSHGWKEDIESARERYDRMTASLRAELDAPLETDLARRLGGRRWAVGGVFWPSKPWAPPGTVVGGAASAGAGSPSGDLRDDLRRLDGPEEDVSQEIAEAVALVERLETDAVARRRFVEILRGLLPTDDPESTLEIPAELLELDGDRLLLDLAEPELPRPDVETGGAAVGSVVAAIPAAPTLDGAVGLADLFGGARAAARRLLNYTTYYRMKARSGVIGRRGLRPLLAAVRARRPDLRLHLVGHSFGARLVTAAADGRRQADDEERLAPLPVDSLSLLQGAFSHFGLAFRWGRDRQGHFRGLIDTQQVTGPILVTHTANDTAVGVAYALASRLARQVAVGGAGIGDAQDRYGGIGRNGALGLRSGEVEAGTLGPAEVRYTFRPRVVFNLRSDLIEDHGDVDRREVMHAVLAAATT